MPLFEDASDVIKLYNMRTGAIRSAPWIVLYTPNAQRYFVNLVTRVVRWFPPHRWMAGWISRRSVYADGITQLPSQSAEFTVCSFFSRSLLPLSVSHRRADGGAPCLGAYGRPQYEPDSLDDSSTYPLQLAT
jgi:hypothetical protein